LIAHSIKAKAYRFRYAFFFLPGFLSCLPPEASAQGAVNFFSPDSFHFERGFRPPGLSLFSFFRIPFTLTAGATLQGLSFFPFAGFLSSPARQNVLTGILLITGVDPPDGAGIARRHDRYHLHCLYF
jgi:hypothetical protein